jgi:hypothetical protein
MKKNGAYQMSFLKELLTSIKFNARERTTNVYIGSFAFSWATINWKFWVILLFGEGTVDSRIEHVDDIINWVHGLVYPILMSAFICIALPWINKLIAKAQNEPNNYVKRMNDVAETKSLKRLAGIERLRAKAASARDRENAAQELATQQLKEQIQQSKDQSQKLTQENEELNSQVINLNEKLNKLDKQFRDNEMEKRNIISQITKEREELIEKVDKLTNKNKELNIEIKALNKSSEQNQSLTLSEQAKLQGLWNGNLPTTHSLLDTINPKSNGLAVNMLQKAMEDPTLKSLTDWRSSPTVQAITNMGRTPYLKAINKGNELSKLKPIDVKKDVAQSDTDNEKDK